MKKISLNYSYKHKVSLIIFNNYMKTDNSIKNQLLQAQKPLLTVSQQLQILKINFETVLDILF